MSRQNALDAAAARPGWIEKIEARDLATAAFNYHARAFLVDRRKSGASLGRALRVSAPRSGFAACARSILGAAPDDRLAWLDWRSLLDAILLRELSDSCVPWRSVAFATDRHGGFPCNPSGCHRARALIPSDRLDCARQSSLRLAQAFGGVCALDGDAADPNPQRPPPAPGILRAWTFDAEPSLVPKADLVSAFIFGEDIYAVDLRSAAVALGAPPPEAFPDPEIGCLGLISYGNVQHEVLVAGERRQLEALLGSACLRVDAETAMALESVPGSDPKRRSAALETLHLRRLEAPILEAMASAPSAAPSRRAL